MQTGSTIALILLTSLVYGALWNLPVSRSDVRSRKSLGSSATGSRNGRTSRQVTPVVRFVSLSIMATAGVLVLLAYAISLLLFYCVIQMRVVGEAFCFLCFGSAFAGLAVLFAKGLRAIWRCRLGQSRGGDSSPPEPPSQDSPRPAPLRPFSPLILSAHADLPNGRSC